MELSDARCCHCQRSCRDVVLLVWNDHANCMVCLKVYHPRAWSQLVQYVTPFVRLGDK